ncbi:hypothetical protein Q3V23_32230 [Streptomyces sp. VNUA116]|uniref:hypothetical protein n=1 Tax=Streptomyces sp. VNUA116 TaxID=3062449 RepID=UPI002676B41B|nr:hypothetical protein [Streptomyces sp. VNUA116]WKU48361.1 hypothetical protein Q3V23_32230 [Streptomyces sp. VNUA116]
MPRLDRVYDRDGLVHALQELYYKAGAMPIDEMERRAGGHGELPHSTVLRMPAGRSMFDLSQPMAFLRVCEVPQEEWENWSRAWNRAWRRSERERQDAALIRYRAPETRLSPQYQQTGRVRFTVVSA